MCDHMFERFLFLLYAVWKKEKIPREDCPGQLLLSFERERSKAWWPSWCCRSLKIKQWVVSPDQLPLWKERKEKSKLRAHKFKRKENCARLLSFLLSFHTAVVSFSFWKRKRTCARPWRPSSCCRTHLFFFLFFKREKEKWDLPGKDFFHLTISFLFLFRKKKWLKEILWQIPFSWRCLHFFSLDRQYELDERL